MEQAEQVELWAVLTEARFRALMLNFKQMDMIGHEIARAVRNSPIPASNITRDVLFSILDSIQQEMIDYEFNAAYSSDEVEQPFIIETLAKKFIADTPGVSKTTTGIREVIKKWIIQQELPWYDEYSKDYVTHLTFAVQMVLSGRADDHSPEVA
jgi:hypothetical protein